MDGTSEPGAGAHEPPGAKSVERRRSSWELGRPSSARTLRGCGACLAITGDPGKCPGSREGVGGGRSSDDGRDNTTRPERRAPASSMHVARREER